MSPTSPRHSTSRRRRGWDKRLSAAADLGDQVDFAVGVERGEIGVLKDLAVDRHRHAFLDLMAEAGIAAFELKNKATKVVRLHVELGYAAGEPARRLTGNHDMRHYQYPRPRTQTKALKSNKSPRSLREAKRRSNLDRQSKAGTRLLRGARNDTAL